MLTIFRRHLKSCKYTSRTERRCKCPIHVEGSLAGKKIRESLDLIVWEGAQDKIHRWESQGSFEEEREPITVTEAVEQFFEDAKARHLSEATLEKYQVLLSEQLLGYCESSGIRYLSEYKLKFLEQADRCQDTGQLLRREGLYHSNLQLWRRQREQGILSGLTPRKRGRKANPQSQLVEEIQQLERQNQRLSKRLQQAQKLPPILIIQENIQPVITWSVRWYQLPAGSIRSGRAIRGKILQALCIMTRPDPIFPRNTNAQI
jgi:hypothetical protein